MMISMDQFFWPFVHTIAIEETLQVRFNTLMRMSKITRPRVFLNLKPFEKILREIHMLVVWQGYFNGILPARKIKEYLWIMQNMFKKGFLFTFCFFHWLTSENKHDFTIQSRAQHTQYNLLHQNSRRFFYGEEVCKSKVMCFRCSYHVPQRFVT